ncbi:hypothetical protein ABU178_03535 [Pantoea osteomyelitidis]|uniref:Uncharacterized protein n=1 Tax=Pantoea osteomyelitidis TaxID=3230026 RepID=A0ABW7PTB7_9GAMM
MKLITVPVSHEAMKRLDFDECMSDDLLELKLDEADFESLWDSGVFKKINEFVGVNIDVYEDEVLTGLSDLAKAKEAVENFSGNCEEPVKKLSFMLDKAIEFKTGVFFFF